MRAWGLLLALLLSIGVNVGMGAALWRRAPLVPPPLPPLSDPETLEMPPIGPLGAGVPPPRSDGERRRLPPGVRRLADELELDGERRDAFLAAHERFFTRTLAAHDRLREAQEALREALARTDAERDGVEPLLAALVAAQRRLDETFVDAFFEVRSGLDPDQARRFLELLGHRRRAHEEGFRRWRESWGEGAEGRGARRELLRHRLEERRREAAGRRREDGRKR